MDRRRGRRGTVRFWDAKQEQGAVVHKATKSLYHARFSADGRWVVDDEGTILDASTGAFLKTLPAPKDQVVSNPVPLPDGKHVLFLRYNQPPGREAIRTGDLSSGTWARPGRSSTSLRLRSRTVWTSAPMAAGC